MTQPEILILAAGASSRMRGADKLAEPIGGIPLLRHVARVALATGLPVNVVLPHSTSPRRAMLAGLAVRILDVGHPETGLSESFRAGLECLPQPAPVIVLLADMPEITTSDLSDMLLKWQDYPEMILRGSTQDGRPGHPVCFPAWSRAELVTLTGDEGAKSVLQRHRERTIHVPLPGDHATTDLDTPEEWAAWRASRGQ
ncbi:MAG: nucleotidyltransferase family protein [Tabrizicola sp.]|nr:nucleotidyltransferase family protein [Tabrizicola sp.]